MKPELANMRNGTEIEILSSGCETVDDTLEENATQNAALNQRAAGQPGQQEKSRCQTTSNNAHLPTALMFSTTIVESQNSYNPNMSSSPMWSAKWEGQIRASDDIANHVPPMCNEYRSRCWNRRIGKHRTANCCKPNCCWLSVAKGSSTPVVRARGGCHTRNTTCLPRVEQARGRAIFVKI